jgi:hypothetical protein
MAAVEQAEMVDAAEPRVLETASLVQTVHMVLTAKTAEQGIACRAAVVVVLAVSVVNADKSYFF